MQRKRLIALLLGLFLILAIVITALTSGLARPGVPGGDVAIVDEADPGTVSQADFDRGMEQSAARLGLPEVPPEDDPQWQSLKDETMQGLLLAIWAEAEAEERGIEIGDDDVEAELEQILAGFQSKKEFGRVVRQSKFCTEEEIEAGTDPLECVDVRRQARLLAVQRQLSEAFSAAPEITEDDAREFYDDNIEAFERPASRDVRVILHENEEKAQEAFDALQGLSPEDEDFEKGWRETARKLSQDQASKDRGGLLEGLVEGQGDPELDAVVFSSADGELSGPVETGRGFYVVQVVNSTEASTQPFEEAAAGIQQQLAAARQQAASNAIQSEFLEKWTRRTNCIEEVEMAFCSGFIPPEPEPIPGQPAPPEPAAVNSTSPIEPGTAQSSIDGNTQTGLPQGPKVFVEPIDPAAAGLPEGAIPVGPGGAPAP